MSDKISPERRSENMRAIKSRDTSCELLLRRRLYREGLVGYRVNYKLLPGKPDIVFTKYKIAVFVDGCFWHGCTKCCRIPKTRPDYWENKIANNQRRSKEVSELLKQQGWHVLRFWEHDIYENLDLCVESIRRLIIEQKGKQV